MYKIKARVPVTGKGWGLAWVEGVAHTEDTALAAKLAAKGYTVTQPAAPKDPEGGPHACPVCGKEYKTGKGLQEHLAKEHPDTTTQ